jgi:hypothetical protein
MVRKAFRSALGAVTTALLAGCLGGQTGQPTATMGSCDSPTQLSSSAVWGGSTVGAAVAAVAGMHEAPLSWYAEPRGASTHTPVDLEDTLQLSVVYDGANVSRDCTDRLHVPVTVMLSTSQSGIVESGGATLELTRAVAAIAGSLSYDGERVALDATLAERPAGVSLAGDLDALAEGLPGASASFAVEP